MTEPTTEGRLKHLEELTISFASDWSDMNARIEEVDNSVHALADIEKNAMVITTMKT